MYFQGVTRLLSFRGCSIRNPLRPAWLDNVMPVIGIGGVRFKGGKLVKQEPEALSASTTSSVPCPMVTIEDYENYAKDRLPLGSLEYLQRGAERDETLITNVEDFSKIKVLPRYLLDVSNRTTEAEAIGKKFKLPIGIAPSGLHKRWHPHGEMATVRAAQNAGTIMIVSSGASFLIEDIAKEAPETEKWLQMFMYDNRSITYDFVKRGEDSGYGALVVTVDMAVKSLRYFNAKNGWKDEHRRVNFERYNNDGVKPSRETANWAYLEELVNYTKLPVILKGILTPEDARLAYQHGAKGIIVSNHGGRQLDGTISSIEALSNIVKEFPDASGNGFELYLDSGVRSGLDAFRALAIGAKFVFVGRAPIWGLFHSGQQGVENVLEILRNELQTVMGHVGCNTLQDIRRPLVQYNFNS